MLRPLKKGTPFGAPFCSMLNRIPDKVRDEVLGEYNLRTIKTYDQEFFEWRQKILEIKSKGLLDDRFGFRKPLLIQMRAVYEFK